MSKKKMFLVMCTIVLVVLVAFYFVNYRDVPANTENDQPQSTSPENTEGPQLVIPETPIGTLGLISALAAGFGMFALLKKRR